MPRHTRRRLLELAGPTALAVLAGCTGAGSQPNDDAGAEAQPGTETAHHDEGTDSGNDHHGTEAGEHHETEGDGHHEEGGDEHGHDHDEGTPQEPSHRAEVSLATEGQQHHYKPHIVWVETGGTVTWQLESGSHDTVAYHSDNDRPLRMPEAAEPWNSDLLTEEGATFTKTFETEGVYDYFCSPHESVGMVGTVIVGQPDAHEQPALEVTQSSLPEGARTELADLAETVNEALGHTH